MSGQACRTPLQRLTRENGTHAGLLLSKYLKVPVDDKEKHPEDRRKLYDAARKTSQSVKPLYELAFKRWEAATKGLAEADLTVHGRLIVGLGGENVLETGLTLHHTYGTPIIPGSALKGLAAHYCDQVWGDNKSEFKAGGGKYYQILFGDTEDAGHIVFYDAWITPESLPDALIHDVITPHHQDYYMSKPDNIIPPTDHDEPNPITFLSVRGTFRICLCCDVPDDEGGKGWTNLALQLLKEALGNWGVGGKTSSGYGRMV
jgi:CRISPR-associated protein Cmr6